MEVYACEGKVEIATVTAGNRSNENLGDINNGTTAGNIRSVSVKYKTINS